MDQRRLGGFSKNFGVATADDRRSPIRLFMQWEKKGIVLDRRGSGVEWEGGWGARRGRGGFRGEGGLDIQCHQGFLDQLEVILETFRGRLFPHSRHC